MSANSGSDGTASGFDQVRPDEQRFDTDSRLYAWDSDRPAPGGQKWMGGEAPVLRGKTEHQLELARNAVVVTLADELRAIIQYAPQHGYSPPRTWSPPRGRAGHNVPAA